MQKYYQEDGVWKKDIYSDYKCSSEAQIVGIIVEEENIIFLMSECARKLVQLKDRKKKN